MTDFYLSVTDENLNSPKFVSSLVVYLSVLNEFLEKHSKLVKFKVDAKEILKKTVKILEAVVSGCENESNEFYVKCITLY